MNIKTFASKRPKTGRLNMKELSDCVCFQAWCEEQPQICQESSKQKHISLNDPFSLLCLLLLLTCWTHNLLFGFEFKAGGRDRICCVSAATTAKAGFIRWWWRVASRWPNCQRCVGVDHPGGELVDFYECRGHSKAKWDLTLDKAARLQAAVAYGCEGGEGPEHRFVGGSTKLSIPMRPPAVITDTYQPSH